ncbi:MAG TPA: hypothetical protein VLY04_18990 [Bryobacteraceae bacterium]|nr:hypothetical protein [Bryobacteraceae bacterium]
MKATSPDKAFIDYAIRKFGVRVRQSPCRTIMLTKAGWQEYGEEVRLPVSPPVIDPSRSEDQGDLLSNLMEYEALAGRYDHEDGRELRDLLVGVIDLQTALGRSPIPPPRPDSP